MQTKYSITKTKYLAIVKTKKEFKGLLWGANHKSRYGPQNLTQDVLGLTSYRVYHWQLLLEEFAPKIV